jgi:hypothetical protein
MDIRRVLPFLLLVPLLGVPVDAGAQAWLPPEGDLFLSLNYQFLTADRDLFSSSNVSGIDYGTRSLDLGAVQSQVLVLDGDFGVTRRLAVNAAVAFVNGRYAEDDRHGPLGDMHGPLDDGSWHGSFQDGRIGARFMALSKGPWILTPAVSYGFPTTDYVTVGHAAPGRGLNELRLGLDWGRALSRRAYLQGNYSYAFMENVGDVALDRSNLSLEFGYLLNGVVAFQAWTDYQNIHGGLDWASQIGPHDLDPHHEEFDEAVFLDHDPAAGSDFWRLGGGLSLQVDERVELYLNVAKTLWGINTHNALTVSFGMSWGLEIFGRRDLGVWEQRDDPNADLDDWLLADLDDGGNDSDGREDRTGETTENAQESETRDARDAGSP